MDAMRALWVRLETVNAVTYFAEESRAAARGAGLRGFWMGYFGFRAAPLGPVGADVVGDAFFNFAPVMVHRSIPDAWGFADPASLVAARSASAAAALHRIAAEECATAVGALSLLAKAATSAAAEGRPLYAANRELETPTDPLEGLWQCCTTLREQRGDSHVVALRAAGVSGCQAHLLVAAEQGVPDEVLRDNRGWTSDEWDGERAALVGRGLLDPAGAITDAGRAVRVEVEAATDAAAAEPWAGGEPTMITEVIAALDPLAHAIVASGTIPYPNPMGLPPVG